MPKQQPSTNPPDPTQVFMDHRELLVSVAYRILGQVTEAEDVAQDAWLRWMKADHNEVENPRGYLVTITTRLAIDRLRRASARRETYVGPWLPEPLLTRGDVAAEVELADSVSTALLLVLETLSPLERAVFVLREAFDLPYSEIAEIIQRNEAAVRQLARRARDHVDARQPRFDSDPDTHRRLTERFIQASTSGDLQSLMSILAPDVTLIGDGGDRARAPRRPLEGADNVARFLVGIAGQAQPDLDVRVLNLSGLPGVVATSAGVPVATASFDVVGGRIQTVYLVANPDKLAGLSVIDPQ